MALEKKKFKLQKEAATAEFNAIVDCFGFNVSTETRERLITMKIGNIDMQTSQEVMEADAFISKIMEGKISFDSEHEEIVYKLRKPIKYGEGGGIKKEELRFGQFTRAKQKGTGVPLNECNFGTMKDDQMNTVLMALTSESDEELFNLLSIPEYNDLRMIGGYFFS